MTFQTDLLAGVEDRAPYAGIAKLVSGGQTGVDRAALDVGLKLGVPIGGWCPLGRKAEDGTIADIYPLQETSTDLYPQRTQLNVRDSDGTLLLAKEPLVGGTLLTRDFAVKLKRPFLVVEPDAECAEKLSHTVEWLSHYRIGVLNVAGPRESTARGSYLAATRFLRRLLTDLHEHR